MLGFFKKRTNARSLDSKEINQTGAPLHVAVPLPSAIIAVQRWMSEDSPPGSELAMSTHDKQDVLSSAMSRNVESIKRAKELIRIAIESCSLKVDMYTTEELICAIFDKVWGLDVVEKYASDQLTDEIRVNAPDKIYVVQNGISRKVEEVFENQECVEVVIKRMIIEDIGAAIDQSNPCIESVLSDGSRLTAVAPPVSKDWTFTLRRHGAFSPTLENYIEKKTFDKNVWRILGLLVRGRASVLISGNVGAGKTTLMRKMAGEHNGALRLAVIGKDLEVRLSDLYPHKDIIELEEKEHLGIRMKELFVTLLRESPDVIIIEEFRGGGEAIEAIRACTRGLDGSMATAHFNSAYEAIEGAALFMLEEGLHLPIDMAKLRVARAFNVVVQMRGDAITGQKKLVSITEVNVDENADTINYNELVSWVPHTDDYHGEGDWLIKNVPSKELVGKLLKNISAKELMEVGWLPRQ